MKCPRRLAAGDPYGTRTRISSLRGWRPNRLDEGTVSAAMPLVIRTGLEPVLQP